MERVPHLPVSSAVEGVASWYGPGFDGRPTAQGEIFRMHDLTAASRTLPLGTRILVKNLKNSKFVIVRVNDRGPYVHGRILDLSLGAAQRLDMVDDGLGKIQIRVIAQGTQTHMM
jgi:rare lipoprotein A